jgi:type I restriction enzyme S subunit
MKSEWTISKLGDLIEVQNGYAFSSKDYSKSGHFVMRIGNVQNGYITLDDPKFVNLPADGSLHRFELCKDDILVSLTGNVGRIGVIKQDQLPSVLNQRVAKITVRKDSQASREFLLLFLFSDLFRGELTGAGHGAAQQNVSTKDIVEIQVPVPPLAKQQRIVGILDKAFSGIATAKANAEKNLQNARAIFESYLQSVFSKRGDGWVEKKVSEISKHSLGKMLDKAKNKGEPKPYLRNVNVRWFTFDLSELLDMRFLSDEAAKYTAVKGDVLVCEGGYPGRAAIWDEDYPIYLQKALHRVRFHEPEHNKWFVYFLYSQDRSGDLRQHFTGTGIQHFTGEVLDCYMLPLAPLSDLRRLIAVFDALREKTQYLESIYQQKLAALDELKKSLLQKAFKGDLS